MGQRHKARCVALEVLYSIDAGGKDNIDESFAFCVASHRLPCEGAEFAKRLIEIVRANMSEIDGLIQKILQNWDFSRLAIVDKNILRLGVAEIKYVPETPIKVAIDEAIELAKKYGSADSGRFVNGVLDTVGNASPAGG